MEATFRCSNGDVRNITVTVNFNNREQNAEQDGNTLSKSSRHQVHGENPPSQNEASAPARLQDQSALEGLYKQHLKNPDYYQMHLYPKGRILIINNIFRGTKRERYGAKQDVENLESLFQYVDNCTVTKYEELKSEKILAAVKDFAKSATNQGFIAAFFMSHGRNEYENNMPMEKMEGVDREYVDVNKLISLFKKESFPHLKDVPILLFFQMCRGTKTYRHGQRGDLLREVSMVTPNDEPDAGPMAQKPIATDDIAQVCLLLAKLLPNGQFIGNVPNDIFKDVSDPSGDVSDASVEYHHGGEPNMLISFSTMEEYMALRHATKGSWFIQDICNIFTTYAATKDIIALMEDVHAEMNERVASSTESGISGCRVGSRTATSFTEKKLYLFPGL